MPVVALVGFALYFALAFGWRTYIHYQHTGSTGWRGITGTIGSAEWFGGVLFVVALIAAVLAPVADLAGGLAPCPPFDSAGLHAAGITLAVIGTALTLWSQLAMGDSWRIGVDAHERTELVAVGPFRWVRNPIFTSMCLGLAGLALLTPNLLAAVALLALLVALQLQVRCVEEPYLMRAHGSAYRHYAARTGRFLPGLGHLKETA